MELHPPECVIFSRAFRKWSNSRSRSLRTSAALDRRGFVLLNFVVLGWAQRGDMQLQTCIVGAGLLEHRSVWLFPSIKMIFVPEDVNSLIIQLTYCYQTHITGIILLQQIDVLCSNLDIFALTWQKQRQQQQQIDLLPDSHLSVT